MTIRSQRPVPPSAISVMRPTTIGLAVISIVLLICAAYPWQSLQAPTWRVKVVDGDNRPVEGMLVRLSFQNHSAEDTSHELDERTDRDGLATFPRQTLRACGLQRLMSILRSAGAGVHASFGPHAWVFAFGQGLQGGALDRTGKFVMDWQGHPDDMYSVIVVRPTEKLIF